MKKILFLLTFVPAFLLSAANYTILLPENPAVPEQTAAKELSEHLSKATGARVVIRKEGEETEGRSIYLGPTRYAFSKGLDLSKFAPEEWCIRAFSPEVLVIAGGRPRGTLYGVYEFLERELGILWLDEESTWIPSSPEYKWNSSLQIRGTPGFARRCVYSYFTDQSFPRLQFLARNRQNYCFDESPGKVAENWALDPPYGSPRACHTFYSYTKNWGPENDDCHSKDAGGKVIKAVNASGPGQLCMSSPKTRQVILRQLREFIHSDRAKGKHPLYYDISSNDTPFQCVCPSCTALAEKYKSFSGVFLDFLNDLASRIAEEYPDVKLHSLAYMKTLIPPEGIRMAPNVTLRLAQLGDEWSGAHRDSMRPLSHPNNSSAKEEFLAWNRLGDIAVWDYWILYRGKGNYPFASGKAIVKNIQFYKSLGITDLFAECEEAHIASFHPLRLWLGLQAMNRPTLDADREINRFMTAYYGPAAPFMREYYDLLAGYGGTLKESPGSVGIFRRKDLTEKFFSQAETLLDKAENAVAGDSRERARIGRERISVDRAMLDISMLRPPMKEFNKKLVLKRYERNYLASCNPHTMPASTAAKLKKELALYLAGLNTDVSLPAEFKNREIVAFWSWPTLRCISPAVVTADPDAAGGRALRFTEKTSPLRGLDFGFYDSKTQAQILNSSIPREKLIKDGKFHFYPAGKIKLTSTGFLWITGSWTIQADLSAHYDTSGLNNNVEVFFSAKVAGPDYIPGSAGENYVAVDQVIAVK